MQRSREWALRCVHEASLHEENSFITLTYSPENLPPGGSLVKRDHQLFIKRLRKTYPVYKFRYFLCGEYGEDLQRPHYHALLFGFDFMDKQPWSESNGHTIYRSVDLEGLWTLGHSWIGSVSWQSAAYVARYCIKKVNGPNAWERYVQDVDPDTGECRYLEPEYIAMSRRPGIAHEWYQKYKEDCRKDFLTHEGQKFKIPRYYDQVLEVEDAERYRHMKQKRKEVAESQAVTPKRRAAMEHHKELITERLRRSI